MAKTGDRISSLAGHYVNITGRDISSVVERAGADVLAQDIRSMAASLLRQDQHRGLRGLVRKVFNV